MREGYDSDRGSSNTLAHQPLNSERRVLGKLPEAAGSCIPPAVSSLRPFLISSVY
jgi:hypothetical protein